jgi:hypothetical protein
MKGLQCLSHEINTSYSTVRRNCGFIEENVWKQRALNSALNTDFHLAHGTGFEWLPLSQVAFTYVDISELNCSTLTSVQLII